MEKSIYPLLFYPDGFVSAINSSPLAPHKPIKTNKPLKPIKPADNSNFFMFIGLLLFIATIFFFVNSDVHFVFGVFSLILSVFFYFQSGAEEKKQSEFPKDLMMYKEKYNDYLEDEKNVPYFNSEFSQRARKNKFT